MADIINLNALKSEEDFDEVSWKYHLNNVNECITHYINLNTSDEDTRTLRALRELKDYIFDLIVEDIYTDLDLLDSDLAS